MNIKVGDIITAYHAGYHQVVAIQPRTIEEHETDKPLIEYRTLLDAKFNVKVGKKTKTCDGTYCEVITMKKFNKQRIDAVKKVKEGYGQLWGAINFKDDILKDPSIWKKS